jgi:CGNR zinc finger protein/putative stress-induced transcription regulator
MEAVESIDYMHDVEPAPGRLALVQRFVNTVDLEHGREQLHSPARLRTLLVELGMLDAGVRVTEPDLERALEIREGLRGLALANNQGVEDSVLEAELIVRIDGRDGVLEPARRDVDGALADLVGIVYTAMADGTWSRLKACRREVCLWLFYDRSRNRSAVWCQMAVCGNRTKTKAYRARREAPPARTGRR